MKKPAHVWRSAITGRFVLAAFALLHAATTIKQAVRQWRARRKG